MHETIISKTNMHATFVTMEFLQCDHRERKLKLAFAHTVSKLGSPVSSKILVTLSYFCTPKK